MTEAAFLLDTNSLIYLARRRSPEIARRIEQHRPGEIVTSAIAYAEFAKGVDWSLPDAADLTRALFAIFPVLPFDEAAGRVYADLPFRRGAFHRLIAAHALALNLTLVTANLPDFVGVSGLRVEDWSK